MCKTRKEYISKKQTSVIVNSNLKLGNSECKTVYIVKLVRKLSALDSDKWWCAIEL